MTSTNLTWGNAMRKCRDTHHSISPDATERTFSRGFLSGLLMIGLAASAVFTLPTSSHAAEIAVGISVRVGPPPLPVYTQPICPGPGYIWTPGYWANDPDNGYYWVPGTWVMAPTPGFLWTPGYWGWGGSAFFWHVGYWGPHVGFYGGINYGFGYPGVGFVGGEWRGGAFCRSYMKPSAGVCWRLRLALKDAANGEVVLGHFAQDDPHRNRAGRRENSIAASVTLATSFSFCSCERPSNSVMSIIGMLRSSVRMA